MAPFPPTPTGGKWQVSADGGREPRWRRDGKELFFLAADNKLMAAEVSESGSTFQPGAVRPLFPIRPVGSALNRVYDVSADGRRLLVSAAVGEEKPTPITLVVNWTAGLRR